MDEKYLMREIIQEVARHLSELAQMAVDLQRLKMMET